MVTITQRALTENETGLMEKYSCLNIDYIEMTVRLHNCLKRSGFNTLCDVVKKIKELENVNEENLHEKIDIRGFGKQLSKELIVLLNSYGYDLKTNDVYDIVINQDIQENNDILENDKTNNNYLIVSEHHNNSSEEQLKDHIIIDVENIDNYDDITKDILERLDKMSDYDKMKVLMMIKILF